jgi:hypothetical protein
MQEIEKEGFSERMMVFTALGEVLI